ncbi:ion transporter [Eubacterium oxidoreducens]|uniref:Voltage-gated potassium channel n=1 Tax=Eubacterium oxidoreducens TaxID=1732 RepID=A0A1G6B4F7_EUBOX|nr:ion transporter [Eubacterium oxidoreducens]SDB15452.1 voltage-gated potassium channel [Eubacterium oxidoreducens]
MIDSKRKRLFELIQIGSRSDIYSRLCDYIIIIAIIVNITLLVLDTFDTVLSDCAVLDFIEYITLAIFIVEYICRIITADFLYEAKSKAVCRCKFLLSFNGIIDLLSILPYFLPLLFPAGFIAFRVLRVLRVFRLFRLNTQYDAFNVVFAVLNEKKNQLFSSVCLILMMMLASSLCMYSLEHNAQPDVFKDAFSGIWWTVSTIFTVGYGDIVPVTLTGKIIAIIISFLGVGLVAIPTGIISAGFVEQYSRMKTLSTASENSDLRFIHLTIEDMHPWAERPIHALSLPSELMIATIIRSGDIIIPNGNTLIKVGDRVVLGAIEFKDDIGITIYENTITENHLWNHQFIRNINLDDQSVIVSVLRRGKSIIPNGNTRIELGDIVTVCTKKNHLC